MHYNTCHFDILSSTYPHVITCTSAATTRYAADHNLEDARALTGHFSGRSSASARIVGRIGGRASAPTTRSDLSATRSWPPQVRSPTSLTGACWLSDNRYGP